MLGTKRPVKTGKVTQAANKRVRVDNEVLSTVEHEYFLMEQLHARIRAEALASHGPDVNGGNVIEPNFRET